MILQITSEPSPAVTVPIRLTSNLRHDPELVIDIRDFMPVLVSSSDKSDIRVHSSFSLANLDRDAGERLHALVSFIQTSQKASDRRRYVGCTQAVAEQIAYLAYWKDYPLEFRIGKFGKNILVMAHFPKQPEFDCVLAVFHDRRELHGGVQKWFDCFCRLVQDHGMLWQIHLIVDKPSYRKLEEPRFFQPDILVEVVEQE
jgi:hypothetical protein